MLEQNPKSYTRIQDLLDIGMNMVLAGLTVKDKTGISTLTPEQEPEQLSLAEHRVTAMCIHAALAEDDFETAYSYVVNRLANLAVPAAQSSQPASRAASLTPQSSFTSATSSAAAPSGRLPQTSSAATARPRRPIADDYSWRAALEAGKYRRTSRTVRPTHIGTAAADPEIRHLEQRLECLSTALRIAPASTLSEILAAFRRAEEELNAAVRRDELEALAWDERGDHADRAAMPGAFDALAPGGGGSGGGRRIAAGRPGSAGREAASPNQQHHAQQQKRRPRRDTGGAGDDTDAAPMSLFDLSRATALAARRNLGAVANLPRHAMALGGGSGGSSERQRHAAEDGEDKSRQDQQQRVRKRDQLRDAAVGTLVSGVGWLINAPAPSAQQRDDER